ncbi:LOW QUALITY PROTEIN: hypothetical protein Bca4012_037071 [Brassica carinata]
MGRVFRIWREDWKKNVQQQWHFVPNHQDYGFTMYMDSPETLEVIDATVRENYMIGEATPVVITYGIPDWMLFPSGPSPPVTIATTSDLVSLISRRPPFADITLLVTFGEKNVAEFQFLSRSDFTIGSSTYVVGDALDERAGARYECLVLGERLLTSERVMNEIFGEQEMLILHRVALEMEYADRVLRPQSSTGVVQRMEIIQLDDDDEMPQPLARIPPADAPSVLWDVGLDLLDYPEFYNTQRDGRLITADSAFWNELIEDNSQSMEGIFLITNNNKTDIGLTQDETVMGGNSEDGNKGRLALNDTEGESSTGSTAIICSQIFFSRATKEVFRRSVAYESVIGGSVVDGAAGTKKEKLNNALPGPTLTLSLACGSAEPDAQPRLSANVDNTYSEGSDTEGGF